MPRDVSDTQRESSCAHLRLRASFGSRFGLAQDFASSYAAERLNFGKVEWFLSTFVRGLTPTAKTNPALRARVFAA